MILDVDQKKTELAANLKAVREARGLSQEILGTLAGVSRRTIQNIEAGKTELGALELASIADRLDISIDELVTGKSRSIPSAESLVSALADALSQDGFREDLAGLLRAYKSGNRGR